jgi:hypothetical protein
VAPSSLFLLHLVSPEYLGIYQSGLFHSLPSRDRHLQLIRSEPDFGAHFNIRGQAMPDICVLLSTVIPSLLTPLLYPHIYSAVRTVHQSRKGDRHEEEEEEEEEEERRVRGEPPPPDSWIRHTDLYLDDYDIAL